MPSSEDGGGGEFASDAHIIFKLLSSLSFKKNLWFLNLFFELFLARYCKQKYPLLNLGRIRSQTKVIEKISFTGFYENSPLFQSRQFD